MRIPSYPSRGGLRACFAVLLAGLAAGCSGIHTYPVSGKITLDNDPLTEKSTVILFEPNPTKGNTSDLKPSGTVDENGNYTVRTNGQAGAPPGVYKVVVTAMKSTPVHPTSTKRMPVAQSLLLPKYGKANATPLEVEVVADPPPGAYDLKLLSK
jgi:hypothetical protein